MGSVSEATGIINNADPDYLITLRSTLESRSAIRYLHAITESRNGAVASMWTRLNVDAFDNQVLLYCSG